MLVTNVPVHWTNMKKIFYMHTKRCTEVTWNEKCQVIGINTFIKSL